MSAPTIPNAPSEAIQATLTRLTREVRLLKIYAGGATLAVALFLIAGASQAVQKQKFAEIDVERLNIVESDGKLRMVISNQARFPDVVLEERTIPGRQGGKQAGMIFYNSKGECGGLVFSSFEEGENYSASAALLFDQYRQDQTIGIQYSDSNGKRSAGLRIWDRPEMPLLQLLDKIEAVKKLPDGPEKQKAMKELEEAAKSPTRIVIGKSDGDKKAAVIMLADAQGRPRIHIAVDAVGDPRLEFLDEAGKVVFRLPPEKEEEPHVAKGF